MGGRIKTPNKARIRFWLGLAISLACLFLAVRIIDLGEASATLARAQVLPILLALATLAITLAAKALRWKVLFYPRYGQVQFVNAFPVLIIGQMANSLFPLRLGEVARAYLIGEREEVSKAFALGTIALEKAIDMFMALLLLVALIPWMPLPAWAAASGETMALTFGLLLVTTMVLIYQKGRIAGIVGRFLQALPLLSRWASVQRVSTALDSLDVLRHGDKWLSLGLLSLVAWASAVFTNYFTLLALDLRLPLVASAFLLLVLQIGVAVPSAPGRIGVFQYLVILALSVFSVGGPSALGVGVLLYLIAYVPPIIGGLLFMWAENISLVSLRRMEQGGETGG